MVGTLFQFEIYITLQQNVFLVTKISEEIFFVAKNTALVTKYEFRRSEERRVGKEC